MVHHYYTEHERRTSPYMLISDFIRGVTVEFEVVPGLFSYRRVDDGTKLLLEYAEIPDEGVVLDLGCGYGAIGIVIAKVNPKLKVYMVDINEEAVRIAHRNLRRNGLSEERISILHGNLYEPVKNLKFRAIYSNPPLSAGYEVVEKIVLEAPNYMEDGGTLQIVVRKGVEKVHKLLLDVFAHTKVLAVHKGYRVLLARKVGI